MHAGGEGRVSHGVLLLVHVIQHRRQRGERAIYVDDQGH